MAKVKGTNRRLNESPQKLSHGEKYFYVDKAVAIAIAVSEAMAPTAEMTGMYFGIVKTRIIQRMARPKATHSEEKSVWINPS